MNTQSEASCGLLTCRWLPPLLLQKYEKLCQQSEQERQQLQRQNEALQSRVRSSTSGPSDKENMRVAKRVQG